MRLTKIYLAGFKSFVDPTTLSFSSNLTSIVGPNGCGKSNIIDAIRWVMGESSAKQLRGGSLTDVIFSGSTARKPVGQAVVELTFDNSCGTLGGEYAKYSEIAIRRVLTRDGQSNYFFNGTRCRRRDVTDVFLGTGMGPRSYAIIEQGMISRFIEAKPDDFRGFLEEAAGISLYKERRRETENRIRHTRDNLSRLLDLRDELARQLQHLEKQAQAAGKYQVFKTEFDTLQAEHCAMAWRRLNQSLVEQDQAIGAGNTQLEACFANMTHHDAAIEKERIKLNDVQAMHQTVQKQFYDLGTEIATIEQSIAHHETRIKELNRDDQDARQALLQLNQQLATDRETLTDVTTQLETILPRYEEIAALTEAAIEQQQTHEAAYDDWRERYTMHHDQKNQPTQQAEVEKTKITHLESQMTQAHAQVDKLAQEKSRLDLAPIKAQLATFEQAQATLSEQLEMCDQTLQTTKQQDQTYHQKIAELEDSLNEKQSRLQQFKGQQASLLALQEAALSKHDESTKAWQTAAGLDEAQRLAEQLQVDPDYEAAIETVLSAFLEGICLPPEQDVQSLLAQRPTDSTQALTFLQAGPSDATGGLLTGVKNPAVLPPFLATMLANVTQVPDEQTAFAQCQQATPEQSFLTPEGVWVAKGWIWVKPATDNPQAGVLAREQALKALSAHIDETEDDLVQIKAALEAAKSARTALQAQTEEWQQKQQQLSQQQGELKGKLHAEQHKHDHISRRMTEIAQAEQQAAASHESAQTALVGCRERLQIALDQMEVLNERTHALEDEKDRLQGTLTQTREAVKAAKEEEHQLALDKQKCETVKASTEANIQRNEANLETHDSRLQHIQAAMIEHETALSPFKASLADKIAGRIDIEQRLQQASNQVSQVENTLATHYREKASEEKLASQIREQLEQLKINAQTAKVHLENETARAETLQIVLEEVVKTLPEEGDEALWRERIDKLDRKIQRLGPINIAAIEEHKNLLERKTYLDAQHDDLEDALSTLENAIKKIDKETRQKFKATYDQVNEGFKALFPKLFGGGQAQMELTGDDLLDTGVIVMARPPGKRNSTISQLSGGEKALTAVALVFSIFQLNPAPFCLLDEVDAPLDDNNVGRFCELVKEMSLSLQFIFISHNKIAMEMAHQLQGVTMREPGVSRLVAVDIDEAASMMQT